MKASDCTLVLLVDVEKSGGRKVFSWCRFGENGSGAPGIRLGRPGGPRRLHSIGCVYP